jgi:hypothetical protein
MASENATSSINDLSLGGLWFLHPRAGKLGRKFVARNLYFKNVNKDFHFKKYPTKTSCFYG